MPCSAPSRLIAQETRWRRGKSCVCRLVSRPTLPKLYFRQLRYSNDQWLDIESLTESIQHTESSSETRQATLYASTETREQINETKEISKKQVMFWLQGKSHQSVPPSPSFPEWSMHASQMYNAAMQKEIRISKRDASSLSRQLWHIDSVTRRRLRQHHV